MLFNSNEFIFIFLPIILLVFYSFARHKLTKLATLSLVIGSFSFYAYWSAMYLPLLLGSILCNYFIGRKIAAASRSIRGKRLLILGVAANLALLGYYKYTGFLLSSTNRLFHLTIPIPDIILPLGISFFTFTQIAYLVDSYKKET